MSRTLSLCLCLSWFMMACTPDEPTGVAAPSAVTDAASLDVRADVSADTEPTLAQGEVQVVTNLGTITIALQLDQAPVTTTNFLQYVDEGFYDGDDGKGPTTFHRVISGFMVQGGGLTSAGQTKSTHAPIVNESTNGLLNTRGTVAMARTGDPHSATSQFFINHVDNAFLDYVDQANPGYAVFGEVVDGMDVVDAIAAVATDSDDRPLDIVLIGDVIRWAD